MVRLLSGLYFAAHIGRSAGGLTTKVFLVTDAAGRMVFVKTYTGNRSEGPMLLNAINQFHECEELIADKAYDSNQIRKELASRSIKATIPPKKNRIDPPAFDAGRYKIRHRVENAFGDLKNFRSIAMRYDKLSICFNFMLCLAASVIEMRR